MSTGDVSPEEAASVTEALREKWLSKKVKNDNMTPTEREQWLRDRGVVVETSNDRRVESMLSNTSNSTVGGDPALSIAERIERLSLNSDSVDGVKFIYLPHDTSRPMCTLTLPNRIIDAFGTGGGDLIPTFVKQFFADGKSIDDTLFKEQAAKQNLMSGDLEKFAANAKEEKRGDATIDATTATPDSPAEKLTSSALTNAAAGGSVEIFPLVRPSSTNHYEGVYIYLDEVGLLKHLPTNTRSSALAQRCGFHPAPNFYGDVFIGRVLSKPTLRNVDIVAEDVYDTTKEWMARAPQENVAWQHTVNEVTGRQGEYQPSIAGTEGVAVNVDSSDGEAAYTWIQNGEEVEITIPTKLDEDGGKLDKSLIKVAFQSRKITVKYDGEVILQLQLYAKLDIDGCTWTLDKDSLVVTGEKASGGQIWPRLES